jgi:hypothetical protein
VSAYDGDPRVTRYNEGIYVLRLDGMPGVSGIQDARVQPSSDGSNFEAFTWGWNPIKHEFPTADEAIRSLIGDPQ